MAAYRNPRLAALLVLLPSLSAAGERPLIGWVKSAGMPPVAAQAGEPAPIPLESRFILGQMALNAVKSVSLTVEGLIKLRDPEAASRVNANRLENAVDEARLRMEEAADENARKDFMTSYMYLNEVHAQVFELRKVGAAFMKDGSWGGKDISSQADALETNITAIKQGFPQDWFIPTLRDKRLQAEWEKFSGEQRGKLARYETQFKAGGLNDEDYNDLLKGLRAQLEISQQDELIGSPGDDQVGCVGPDIQE